MKKGLFIAVLVLLLGLGTWFAGVYFLSFSKGTRSGELIKFSNKGVIFKTWEGEISQGISGTNIFRFSVEDKDDKIIEKLKDYQGRYVKIEYKERYKTFPWLGDTKYFVIEVIEGNSPHFK